MNKKIMFLIIILIVMILIIPANNIYAATYTITFETGILNGSYNDGFLSTTEIAGEFEVDNYYPRESSKCFMSFGNFDGYMGYWNLSYSEVVDLKNFKGWIWQNDDSVNSYFSMVFYNSEQEPLIIINLLHHADGKIHFRYKDHNNNFQDVITGAGLQNYQYFGFDFIDNDTVIYYFNSSIYSGSPNTISENTRIVSILSQIYTPGNSNMACIDDVSFTLGNVEGQETTKQGGGDSDESENQWITTYDSDNLLTNYKYREYEPYIEIKYPYYLSGTIDEFHIVLDVKHYEAFHQNTNYGTEIYEMYCNGVNIGEATSLTRFNNGKHYLLEWKNINVDIDNYKPLFELKNTIAYQDTTGITMVYWFWTGGNLGYCDFHNDPSVYGNGIYNFDIWESNHIAYGFKIDYTETETFDINVTSDYSLVKPLIYNNYFTFDVNITPADAIAYQISNSSGENVITRVIGGKYSNFYLKEWIDQDNGVGVFNLNVTSYTSYVKHGYTFNPSESVNYKFDVKTGIERIHKIIAYDYLISVGVPISFKARAPLNEAVYCTLTKDGTEYYNTSWFNGKGNSFEIFENIYVPSEIGWYDLKMYNSSGYVFGTHEMIRVDRNDNDYYFTVDKTNVKIGDIVTITGWQSIEGLSYDALELCIYFNNNLVGSWHIRPDEHEFTKYLYPKNVGTYKLVMELGGNPIDNYYVEIKVTEKTEPGFGPPDQEDYSIQELINRAFTDEQQVILGFVMTILLTFLPFLVSLKLKQSHVTIEIPPILYGLLFGVGISLSVYIGLFPFELFFFLCFVLVCFVALVYLMQKGKVAST